ncbi:hypothetical protein OF83DRAFT_1172441 [Amylostereum chailletii]|nr:hypothetical protein OF83DRAFT_1172441 [Amylostereum chailletii]
MTPHPEGSAAFLPDGSGTSIPTPAPLIIFDRPFPYSPIRRLPPELFCMILDELMQDRNVLSGCEEYLPLGIIISQVCRQWRDIAYACPRLWTIIPVQNTVWTERAFDLSRTKGGSSLPITATPGYIPDDTYVAPNLCAIQLVADESHRIEDLFIMNADETMHSSTEAVLRLFEGRSAPMLKSLAIDGGEFLLAISDNFLNVGTLRIESLLLFDVIIDVDSEHWQRLFTSSMKFLSLDATNVWPDMDMMLSGLSLVSLNLESLDLWTNNRDFASLDLEIPLPFDDLPLSFVPPHSIIFPRLKTFKITDHINRLPTLMGFLKIPNTLDNFTFVIRVERPWIGGASVAQVIAAQADVIAAMIRDILPPVSEDASYAVRKSELVMKRSKFALRVELRAIRSPPSNDLFPFNAKTMEFEWTEDGADGHLDLGSAVVEVLRRLPEISEVPSLTYTYHTHDCDHILPADPTSNAVEPPPNFYAWDELSRTFTSLSRLTIRGLAACAFIQRIFLRHDELFPKLNMLVIQKVNLREGDSNALFFQLFSVLKLRWTSDLHPPIRVEFQDCVLDRSQQKRFVDEFGSDYVVLAG